MELIAILRLLWRRRILVGIGVLAAVGAGLLTSNGTLPVPGASTDAPPAPRKASVRVLLDTDRSQLVAPAPPAADTVAARAVLLADVLAGNEARAAIARRAGLKPEQLAVIGPAATVPTLATKLAERTATVVESAPEPFRVTADADGELPIVSIAASAPGADVAKRLASAAAAELAALTRPGDAPAGGRAAIRLGFVAQPLSEPVLAPVESRPGPALIALAACVAAFALWCGLIVLASGLRPAPRRARARAA
jgi:hypothetical protein